MRFKYSDVNKAFKQYDKLFPENDWRPFGKTPFRNLKKNITVVFDKSGKARPAKLITEILTGEKTPEFKTNVAVKLLKDLGFQIGQIFKQILK